MKKFLNNRLFISSVLCILLAVILMILKVKFNLTLFLFNLTTIGWVSILLISAFILFGVLMIKALSSLKKQMKKATIITSIASVFGVLFISFCALCIFIFVFNGAPKFFVFYSPDKQHTIVVEEDAFLLVGYGCIYEKVNPVFLTYTDGYVTDDGYRPFSSNDYQLDWKHDSLTIKYGYGSEGVKKKLSIDFMK